MKAEDQLTEAVQQGNRDLARQALQNGADVNARFRSATALWWACQEGHLDIARLLINRGADINAKDDEGFTPLAQAVGESHLDLVRCLIESGANPNQISNEAEGGTPLHTACADGLAVCAELLLSLGADTTLKDRNGRAPSTLASVYGHNQLAEAVEKWRRQP